MSNPFLGRPATSNYLNEDTRDTDFLAHTTNVIEELSEPDIFEGTFIYEGVILEKFSDQTIPGGEKLASYYVRVSPFDDHIKSPFEFVFDSPDYKKHLKLHQVFTCLTEDVSNKSFNPREGVWVCWLGGAKNRRGATIMFPRTITPMSDAGQAYNPPQLGLPYRTKPTISQSQVDSAKKKLEKQKKQAELLAKRNVASNIVGKAAECILLEVNKIARKGAKYIFGAAGSYSVGAQKTSKNVGPPGAYDCSGIFYAICFSMGAKIPRTSRGMSADAVLISEELAKKTKGAMVFLTGKRGGKTMVTHVEMSNGNGTTLSGSQIRSGVSSRLRWGWWTSGLASGKWQKVEYGILPQIKALSEQIKQCPVMPASSVQATRNLKQECKRLAQLHGAKPASSAEWKQLVACWTKLNNISIKLTRTERKVAFNNMSPSQAQNEIARQNNSNQRRQRGA